MDNSVQCYDGDGKTTPEVKDLIKTIEQLKAENDNLRLRHEVELDSHKRAITHLSDKFHALEHKMQSVQDLADSRYRRLMKISHNLYSREDMVEEKDFRSQDDLDCQDERDDDDD